jgi:hypothetical protein
MEGVMDNPRGQAFPWLIFPVAMTAVVHQCPFFGRQASPRH